MKRFIGTKLINATPMTRAEYNTLRGWELPADENGGDEGFLVEYIDGGKANHPDFAGYVSWSPKDVFERAYRPTSGMTFGDAIEAIKAGQKVCRAGWNGKGMWIGLCREWNGSGLNVEHADFRMLPFIYMRTAQADIVPWLASQTDLLADDWLIINSELGATSGSTCSS